MYPDVYRGLCSRGEVVSLLPQENKIAARGKRYDTILILWCFNETKTILCIMRIDLSPIDIRNINNHSFHMQIVNDVIVFAVVFVVSIKGFKTFSKSKKDLRVILNLNSDSSQELIRKVEEAVNSKPSRLTLTMQQRAHVDQDVVLILISLLEGRDKGTHLHVDLRSSIYDGVLQIVLMADSRTIRQHVWAMIDSPKRVKLMDFSDSEHFSGNRAPVCDTPFVQDYLKIASMMNQYIEVEKVADKRWDLSNLKDYMLLPSKEEEEQLQGLFSGKEQQYVA